MPSFLRGLPSVLRPDLDRLKRTHTRGKIEYYRRSEAPCAHAETRTVRQFDIPDCDISVADGELRALELQPERRRRLDLDTHREDGEPAARRNRKAGGDSKQRCGGYSCGTTHTTHSIAAGEAGSDRLREITPRPCRSAAFRARKSPRMRSGASTAPARGGSAGRCRARGGWPPGHRATSPRPSRAAPPRRAL